VVTVTSLEHRGGSITSTTSPGKVLLTRAFYQQSKFANVLFGLELDRRVRAAGIPVRWCSPSRVADRTCRAAVRPA